VIDPRRAQLGFGDRLIAEEVKGLHEDWMIHADQVLADDGTTSRPRQLGRFLVSPVATASQSHQE
jgi:hypothetical protein